uniref:NOL1/NOP2/Sun domain family member 4 n=3 Tax=Schistosoma mansoni TaxID=6183 RepID=A0A5K4EZQ1_SCHMA
MRIALLMPPKKAILYNRYFPNVGDTISSSYNNDGNDSFSPNINFIQTLIKHQNSLTNNVSNADKNPVIIDELINVTQSDSRRRQFLTRYSPSDETMDTINLNEFMPSTELISENEMYTRECDTDFTFYSKDYYGMIKEDGNDSSGLQSLKVLTENFHIPEKLCIKCSPPGRLVTIPHPTYLNGQFNFNTIDLSSVITILALNLQKNDNMVNMSTFSGTKSVIALQTGLLNRLLCVLRSPSRSTHVQQMINTFKASGIISEENDDEQNNNTKIDIVYSHDDLAAYFSNDIDKDYKFNKILVNVPCSADRYAITSGDSHVFGMGQARLRAQLPKIQLNLLRQAMELCQPNGYVVYSTSTLSPSQNQEIIQSFILNHSNNINFALINLKPLYDLLTACYSKLGIKVIPIHLPLFDNNNNNMSKEDHDTNLSSNNTCHGLLIIPSISCNYGPTFIVKFKRLP